MTGAVRLGTEGGSVSIFLVGLATALLMMAGLLYDGGQILAARREAFALADNAARAGAQAVDLDLIRSGGPARLAPIAAEIAARGYLERAGHQGTVVVGADRVDVTVSTTVELHMLQMVGLKSRTVTGTGEARIVRGITTPEG